MSIHTMTDEQLLLALCIWEEQLDNPAEWCREFRQLSLDTMAGPKTSDEAHALMARKKRLRDAIKKAPDPEE